MRTLIVTLNLLDPLCNKLRGMLRALANDAEPNVVAFERAEQTVLGARPDLVVLVLSPEPDRGLEVLRTIRRGNPGHVLAVGPVADPQLILRALQCGADHYLDQDELDGQLEAGLSRLKFKKEALAPTGRLLTVLASSGGTGASTLAVNIATVLAKDHQKCAIIDLNSGRGDIAALLDLKPQFNLADLCLNVARLDRGMFEKMLVRHENGVYLLGAPQRYSDARVVTTQGVAKALHMARAFFPYVVVDLEDCFHEEQVHTLRQSTGIVLVSRLDFTALRNARRILEYLQELDIPRNRVRLVINRHGQPNELPVNEAEGALGEKLVHFVPDDAKTINGANNAGIPAVLKAPNTRIAQSIVQLARTIADRRRDAAQAPYPTLSPQGRG